MTAKKDVRILSKETEKLAAELMVKTVAAHYIHGLPPGERLDFEIIAEESVQAACAFEDAVAKERATNLVSLRNTQFRAAKQGRLDGFHGRPKNEEIPDGLLGHYEHGYEQGAAARAQQN
jgi:hypothetical protein